ncbi:MAG: hypothetical protein ACRDTG_26970 [Pseudonocardiaceae bacterium]
MIITPNGGAPSRVARTGAATGVALAAAACGHLGAGSTAVGMTGLLAAAAMLVVPAWWLTGRERGWGPLAGALLVGQLAAHVLFTVTAPGAVLGAVTAMRPEHHEMSWLSLDLMLLGHLMAAAVGAAWLRRGERRAWAAARRATAALQRTLSVLLGWLIRIPVDGCVVRWHVPAEHPIQHQRAVLRNTIILRGPPLGG